MNHPRFGPAIDLWALVSPVTLARVTVGLAIIAAAAWLVSRWPRPARR